MLNDQQESMSAVAPFKIDLLKDAREASHAQRIHTNRFGHVVSDVFEVEIAGITGVIKIEYPAVLLKRAMGQTNTGNTRNVRLDQLKDSLIKVPLAVTGTIPMTSMSMNEVVDIKEGDFLPLPPSTDTAVSVGGVPFFNADLKAHKGRLILEINQSLRSDENVS